VTNYCALVVWYSYEKCSVYRWFPWFTYKQLGLFEAMLNWYYQEGTDLSWVTHWTFFKVGFTMMFHINLNLPCITRGYWLTVTFVGNLKPFASADGSRCHENWPFPKRLGAGVLSEVDPPTISETVLICFDSIHATIRGCSFWRKAPWTRKQMFFGVLP